MGSCLCGGTIGLPLPSLTTAEAILEATAEYDESKRGTTVVIRMVDNIIYLAGDRCVASWRTYRLRDNSGGEIASALCPCTRTVVPRSGYKTCLGSANIGLVRWPGCLVTVTMAFSLGGLDPVLRQMLRVGESEKCHAVLSYPFAQGRRSLKKACRLIAILDGMRSSETNFRVHFHQSV